MESRLALEVAASGAFGIAAGVLSGFLGIGGGSILPPLLVLLLGVDQHRAQGISLAALLPPVGLPAIFAYRRSGVRPDVRLVVFLIFGFLFGAIFGAWLAHRVPSRQLRWLFAGFLAFLAVHAATVKPKQVEDEQSRPRRAVGAPVGFIAGAMSGLLGVGGGIVALPLLERFGRLTRLQAQATTLAMLLPPIGLPAVYVYAREQGGLPWALLVAVAAGFAVGAALGANLAGKANARLATRIYAAFLALTALVLVVHA